LAWGTSGLEPKATIVKCPVLMPGEKGIVSVTFQAPSKYYILIFLGI
jgi:hypothetical protein